MQECTLEGIRPPWHNDNPWWFLWWMWCNSYFWGCKCHLWQLSFHGLGYHWSCQPKPTGMLRKIYQTLTLSVYGWKWRRNDMTSLQRIESQVDNKGIASLFRSSVCNIFSFCFSIFTWNKSYTGCTSHIVMWVLQQILYSILQARHPWISRQFVLADVPTQSVDIRPSCTTICQDLAAQMLASPVLQCDNQTAHQRKYKYVLFPLLLILSAVLAVVKRWWHNGGWVL